MGFLAWLNPIKAALDLIGSIINKAQDVSLEKYKVNGTVNVEAMRTDLSIIQARAEVAKATYDDPVNRWGRRLFIYPVGLWFTLIILDSCFRNLLPDYTWRILALPPNLDYIPYAVIAYLFVTAWKK